MAQRSYNLFPHGRRLLTEKHASVSQCVFISYRTIDRNVALWVADELETCGIYYYLDAQDAQLAVYRQSEDATGIAQCIESGLDSCTHLLGIMSAQTQGSWWVPYEVGGARGRRADVAHIVTKDAKNLPAYVKLARLLWDLDDFYKWLLTLHATRPYLLEDRFVKKGTNIQAPMPPVRLAER